MQKRIVTLEYEIRIVGGELLESSATRGPLRFVAGTGQLLPALEKLVDTLGLDQEASGVLAAKEAFGDDSQIPIKTIARSEFPGEAKLERGMVFEAGTPTGERIRFVVVDVTKDAVQVRYMHPLHDNDVAYRVKVLSIEDARRPPALPASAVDLEIVDD